MKNEKLKFSRFKRKLKEDYPSIKFTLLEDFNKSYKKRFRSRILKFIYQPKRHFGWNGIGFLLRSLQRSRLLYCEFIHNVNKDNIFSAYFLIRGHFETTGSVAYLQDLLTEFYAETINIEQFESGLKALSLGSYLVYPEELIDEPNLPNIPKPIRVGEQIKKVDKIFNEKMDGRKPDIFKECYSFLSEFCHPNLFGSTVGTNILESMDISILQNPILSANDLNILINDMLISCSYFFEIYDQSVSLLKSNEEIPETVK